MNVRRWVGEVSKAAHEKNLDQLAALDATLRNRLADEPSHFAELTFLRAVVNHYLQRRDCAAILMRDSLAAVNWPAPFQSPPAHARMDQPLPPIEALRYFQFIYGYYEEEKIKLIKGMKIYFSDDLDGGGTTFGQEYFDYLHREHISKGRTFGRAMEWCSGPGFIGFGLLAHQQAQSLALVDIYEKAIRASQKTVAENDLPTSTVQVYLSDNLDAIPPDEKWDLIVGNPPHHPLVGGKTNSPRRAIDEDWRIHETFFAQVGRHLADDGLIVLVENGYDSEPGQFNAMIRKNALEIVSAERLKSYRTNYFLEIRHARGAAR
jgi:SAM-dependent methyltransferase